MALVLVAQRSEFFVNVALTRSALVALFGMAALLGACASPPPARDHAALNDEVRAAETAFAATMAARNLDAFASFVADDAVFINSGDPLRGKQAVVEHWARFFKNPQAPFAWRPELIEVLGSGTLGYSEGPVTRPDGKVVARYYSTWRRTAAGHWQIVFDNGYDVCACAKR